MKTQSQRLCSFVWLYLASVAAIALISLATKGLLSLVL